MRAVSAEMLALANIEFVAVANAESTAIRTSPIITRDATNDFFIRLPVIVLFNCSR